MQEFLDAFQATNWKNESDKKGTRVDYRKSVRDIGMVKLTRTIPFNNLDIFLTLCAGEFRQDYDTNMDATSNIQKLAANTFACMQLTKKIAVISPREFIIINYSHIVSFLFSNKLQQANGDILIIAFSDDSVQNLLPIKKDIVRGELVLAGWLLKKVDEKTTEATHILELNFKGSIPQFVINNTLTGQADMIAKLPVAVEKFLASQQK